MGEPSHRKLTKRAFKGVYNAECSTSDEKSDLKTLKNARNKAATAKMYPRHEIMFSKEPGLENYAFRKELTVTPSDYDYSLTSDSTDSLSHSYNRISTRLRGGIMLLSFCLLIIFVKTVFIRSQQPGRKACHGYCYCTQRM